MGLEKRRPQKLQNAFSTTKPINILAIETAGTDSLAAAIASTSLVSLPKSHPKPPPSVPSVYRKPADVTLEDASLTPETVKLNKTDFAFCDYSSLESKYFSKDTTFVYNYNDTISRWEPGATSPGAEHDNLDRIANVSLGVIMSNVAASLTKLTLEKSNYTIYGSTTPVHMYVNMRWAWLILPGLLVLIGNIFLMSTVVANS